MSEAVVPQAQEHLDRSGAGDRAEVVPGDFFVSVPDRSDIYLLSRVPHDWDDHEAGRILDTCRSAMAPSARLLVVEAILPERVRDAPAVIRMDLHMLILLGAERAASHVGYREADLDRRSLYSDYRNRSVHSF